MKDIFSYFVMPVFITILICSLFALCILSVRMNKPTKHIHYGDCVQVMDSFYGTHAGLAIHHSGKTYDVWFGALAPSATFDESQLTVIDKEFCE